MGIVLPADNWFVQVQGERLIKNTYTGSCGTNPDRGCLSEKVFNYKVYVQGESLESASLVAECYIRLPWSEELKKTDVQKYEIAFNAEGIMKASEWLSIQSQKLNKLQL